MSGDRDAVAAHYKALFREMKSRVSAEIELVTPEMAGQWLGHNKGNRPLAIATVERYQRYQRTGEWLVNGEGVIIDEADNLLDGQHRLEAVVRSGVPVPMLVVYGVPQAAFATLNTGKTRSLADVLAIGNEANARSLAGALRLLHRDLQGKLGQFAQAREKASHAELAALLHDHPRLRDSLEFVAGKCKSGLHPASLWAFVHYRIATRHKDADDFFTRVLTQEGIAPRSPESVLNTWFQSKQGRDRSQAGALHYLAMVIKTWNAVVTGSPLKQLKWMERESFPEIL